MSDITAAAYENEAHLAALEARDNELAHADEVAARLVEEVCRDEVLIRTLHGALIEAADQRDAARAQIESLGIEVAALVHDRTVAYKERDAARAEVAEDGWELEVARKQGAREAAEEIAQALESELEMSSRVPPPEDAPWEYSSTRIHGTAEVRADAAAIARRIGGTQ